MLIDLQSIVNDQNQVIAIAARGKDIVPNEIIPIKQAIELYNRHMESVKGSTNG
ncbi:hypothetical protein ACE1TH_13155 [Shouchella sp. JSM 1781072]|uniref:hypothetical protein n=1 Tax=Shouchella sp. JSM 1781072 TaxID=3344581 RepID=UPI0035BFE5B0